MYNFTARLFLALSVAGTPTAAADLIGSVAKAPPLAEKDECSCSPTSFTFQLKLNSDQTCDHNTIEGNPGVAYTTCGFAALEPFASDLRPVRIESIQIHEQRRDFVVVLQEEQSGIFFDGHEFSYTSISNDLNPDEQFEDQEVPLIMQITLFGKNAADQGVRSLIAVYYDLTHCNAEPIAVGDTIGIVQVVEYTPANPAFCPAIEIEPPTTSPSSSPTDIPTNPPTSPRPTGPPTRKPTTKSKSGKLIRGRN